jgi:hypothetical protein
MDLNMCTSYTVILKVIFDLHDINMGFHPIPGFFSYVPKKRTKRRAQLQIVSDSVCFSPAR